MADVWWSGCEGCEGICRRVMAFVVNALLGCACAQDMQAATEVVNWRRQFPRMVHGRGYGHRRSSIARSVQGRIVSAGIVAAPLTLLCSIERGSLVVALERRHLTYNSHAPDRQRTCDILRGDATSLQYVVYFFLPELRCRYIMAHLDPSTHPSPLLGCSYTQSWKTC
jgi:hypothetical protein